MTSQAYLYEAIRTPRGKASPAGGLADSSPIELLGALFDELAARTGIDPATVDDVVIGAARQHFDQGSNIARVATIMAGWPESVPGTTISRACASGLEAVNTSASRIRAGDAMTIVAGGVESLSRVPMFSEKSPLWNDPVVGNRAGAVHMGVAADLVATLLGYEREELDQYGLSTQLKAAAAQRAGRFDRSLVAITSPDGSRRCDHDEQVRPQTTMDQLRLLEPAFCEFGASGQDAIALKRFPQLSEVRHLHTRGTSPSLADGAGLLLIGDEDLAAHVRCAPRARIVATAVRAVDPVEMLTAGQDAVTAVIERAGLTLDDIDRFEFAEAFSALCLKIQRELHIEDERFNVNGGTIAIGHAFGATGPFLLANLVDELERSGGRYGVAAISGAVGIGVATLIERVE